VPRLIVRQETSSDGRLYSFDYVDPAAPEATRRIPGLRLLARVLFGPDTRPWVEAIIDTGAAISVIPHRFWSRLPPGECVRLLPAGLPAGDTHRRSNILGRPYTYQFGRLHVAVIDTEGRRLRAVPVVGQLVEEPDHPLDRPIMGLSESVLTGRTLRRNYSARFPFEQEWWLQEA
jgi:hypothetical protein